MNGVTLGDLIVIDVVGVIISLCLWMANRAKRRKGDL